MVLETSGNDHSGVPDGNNITSEIADAIIQATVPAGIDNPNTVVQVCVYPVNGPAYFFRRYKHGPLLVGDFENDLVDKLLDSQMNPFHNSFDGLEFNEGTSLVLSFYDVPNFDDLHGGREAVNLNLY